MKTESNSDIDSDSLSVSSDEVDCEYDNAEFLGEVLILKYLIIKKIGYGAYSSVWLAYNIEKKKFYAIKVQNNNDYYEGLDEVNVNGRLWSDGEVDGGRARS